MKSLNEKNYFKGTFLKISNNSSTTINNLLINQPNINFNFPLMLIEGNNS